MTYVERLRAIEAATPRREYLTQAEYRQQKAALTRAKNSGSPKAVLAACEKAVEAWNGKVWPDDWNHWRIALEDAAWEARSQGFGQLYTELMAASQVLFR